MFVCKNIRVLNTIVFILFITGCTTFKTPLARRSLPNRTFSSQIVENKIIEVSSQINDSQLKQLFINCYPNTLDTTIKMGEKGGVAYTYIITGDIDAMWLRDSSAQVHPFIRFVNEDKELDLLVRGLINSHVQSILFDPYANAFYDSKRISKHNDDITQMKPGVHERKWEIDSLCYSIRLIYEYWKISNDDSLFDTQWKLAMDLVVKTFREQQRKENDGPYSFQRLHNGPTETQTNNGFGEPVNPVGLICSAFRPSDDSTRLLFLIPSNYFAVSSLRQLSQMYKAAGYNSESADAKKFSEEVQNAISQYGTVNHPKFGEIIAYETDGFGNYTLMDDANIPSLVSLPYLGLIDATDPIYQQTRSFIFSKENPFYFEGKFANGVGSPHTPGKKVWPMSLIMRALTSDNDEEIMECLKMLVSTHADTGLMHESFNPDRPRNYTRSWFSWANTLFGELIVKISEERPHLLEEFNFDSLLGNE